jgi:CheY-like chemotaxis protein
LTQPLLIIDDEENLRMLIADICAANGYRVVTAESGAIGLELAATVQPCAILLDVQMRGLSGWETLERLKADPSTRAIPVVMMSGSGGPPPPALRGAFEAFLTKPVPATVLLETLERACAVSPALL